MPLSSVLAVVIADVLVTPPVRVAVVEPVRPRLARTPGRAADRRLAATPELSWIWPPVTVEATEPPPVLPCRVSRAAARVSRSLPIPSVKAVPEPASAAAPVWKVMVLPLMVMVSLLAMPCATPEELVRPDSSVEPVALVALAE